MNTSIHKLMLEQIHRLAESLGDDWLKEMVFVGGCTTGIHVTDDFMKETIRHTNDVDLIVSIQTSHDWNSLQEVLIKEHSFKHPPMNEDHPICRLFLGDLPVDFMPINSDILGFTNYWYEDGMAKAVDYSLESGKVIKVLTAPHFIATKFEAFKGRGNDDYLASHDIEDILTVISGRVELVEEIKSCDPELKGYIVENLEISGGQDEFDYAVQSIQGDLTEVIYDRMNSIMGADKK